MTLDFLRANFVRKTRQKLVIKIRTNLEHFEVAKVKNKKRIKTTVIYFFLNIHHQKKQLETVKYYLL